jgi:hypothetical protein
LLEFAHWISESRILIVIDWEKCQFAAALLVPWHHHLEHWRREKIVEKDKAIGITEAKKTIQKLEYKPGNN